jgi:hypothetical protein
MRAAGDANPIAGSSSLRLFEPQVAGWFRFAKCPLRVCGRSGDWMPPPVYRNNEACDQGNYLDADLYPVPDRGGISMRNPARRVENQPVEKTTVDVVHDFSLDEAIPYFAVAIDAQIDRDDASDNFIKEKLHASIRSSSH